MALQTGVITFTGKLGNVIGYAIEDKHFVRSMPEHVERSTNTKRSAMDFGKATKTGRLIRRALLPNLDLPHDRKLTNRINQALLTVLKMDTLHLPGQKSILPENLPALKGFNLNEQTGLEKLCTFKPVVIKEDTGNVRITWKPLMKKTKNTTHIEIKALLFNVDPAEGKQLPVVSDSILIDVKAPPEKVELLIPYDGKEVAFVVMQVLPYEQVSGEQWMLCDLKYLAADIIDVLLPEKEEKTPKTEGEHPKKKLFTTPKGPRSAKGHSPPGN